MSAGVPAGRTSPPARAWNRRRGQVLFRPAPQVFRERGRAHRGSAWRARVAPAARRPHRGPSAVRFPRACLRNFTAKSRTSDTRKPQSGDLFFQRADGGDLAPVGRHAPEKQIPRHVEGARHDTAAARRPASWRTGAAGPPRVAPRQLVHLAVGRQQRSPAVR